MLTKRIIPCLDVKDGQVVKGTRFVDLKSSGDPVDMAIRYEEEGADELVLLDITASLEARNTFLDVVTAVAKHLSIPLTVGGGISNLSDIRRLLQSGVDKVAINSAALGNPRLLLQASEAFGSQCVVLAIDVKRKEGGWEIFSHGGSKLTGKDALEWALEGQRLGAGELLVTSIDRDGTKVGYDLELMRMISTRLSIPVIASGGVGKWEDIRDVFIEGKVDAALAASLFHSKSCSIRSVKEHLNRENIMVRL